MLALDQLREISQSLRRHRTRALLTAFGVFWAVMMLVIMLGFGRGFETGMRKAFGTFALKKLGLWPLRTGLAYKGGQPGRQIVFTPKDVEALRALPGLRVVLPRSYHRGVARRGAASMPALISGDEPELGLLEPMDVSMGRFLSPRDLDEHAKVAVLGRRVVERLFRTGESALGEHIMAGGSAFKVVGTFASRGAGNDANELEERVLVPRTTYLDAFDPKGKIITIEAVVDDAMSSERIGDEIFALLKIWHGVHPDDTRAVRVWKRERGARRTLDLFAGTATLIWLVGGLTLLSGTMSISNIMVISVAERVREIGIRKAIGARPRTIAAQILLETLFLALIAGAFGLGCGVGILEITEHLLAHGPAAVTSLKISSPELTLAAALSTSGLLVVSSLCSAVLPIRSALAIRPVEAFAQE